MKSSTLVGIFAVLVGCFVGFALGRDHTKPRVKANRYLIHQLLKQPKNDATFVIKDDHWEVIQKRYEGVDPDGQVEDQKWDSWTPNTEVTVTYDTVEEEIRISCKKQGCNP